MQATRTASVTDYSCVTETPRDRVTQEALSMLCARYSFAASFAAGRSVLEVASGSGAGLGYLATRAKRVVGGDYTARLLVEANRHYRGRIPLLRLDAHALPFRSGSFGLVVLHEALYYLAAPDQFVGEARRVLERLGLLVISTVNPEWCDFNPSPLSTRYFSGAELLELLRRNGFDAEVFGAFPVVYNTLKRRGVSWLRRVASRLHLIPKTMRGKELLKRIFIGPLAPFPAELCGDLAPYAPPPVGLDTKRPIHGFKVLLAVGRRD